MPKSSKSLTIKKDKPDGRPANAIHMERIIALRNKGLSLAEIAGVLNCSKQNIHERLQGYAEDIDALQDFKDNKADTLAVYQRRMLNSLTPGDIKSASPYQRVGMFALLYDKERLERGQTTENIGYMDYNHALDQVMRERERLQDELGIEGDTIDIGDVSD